jgi:hypothetical protein
MMLPAREALMLKASMFQASSHQLEVRSDGVVQSPSLLAFLAGSITCYGAPEASRGVSIAGRIVGKAVRS